MSALQGKAAGPAFFNAFALGRTAQEVAKRERFHQDTSNGPMTEVCVFCRRQVPTRGHHVVPRCKGGTEIVPTCHSCEDFIHKTWSHNELRDTFNTVDKILADARFQKFLRWLHKQHEGAVFRSQRNRTRPPGRYR